MPAPPEVSEISTYSAQAVVTQSNGGLEYQVQSSRGSGWHVFTMPANFPGASTWKTGSDAARASTLLSYGTYQGTK
jgi:hypothetical protein